MKILIRTVPVILLALFFANCNHVTYTPRSKKKIQQEKPSVVLLDKIIEYREQFNSWPFSKEEFMSKDPKYREAFNGFPYLRVTFKVIDNNNMTFSFSEHVKDVQNFKDTDKVDLNSYNGEVKFYWEKDKFIWKIKMK